MVVVMVMIDASVSYHDAWRQAAVAVVVVMVVVRRRRAGVVQEGLLAKRQVIHHS